MSSVSWDIAVGVAFAVGVLLFGISSAMLRSTRPAAQPPVSPPPPPAWPQLVDPDLRDAPDELRLDMIARLSWVNNAWSREILERARAEERDPAILAAIDRVF